MGLDIGGDDYITKPFKLGVLMSRVNALLRRAGGGTYRICLIHGSHGGTALRDFIRSTYSRHPKVKRLIPSPDGGSTELVLREYV